MVQPDTEIEQLQRRFANRLNLALNEAGYTQSRAMRAKELASMVGTDEQLPAGWLGGHMLPTWEQLIDICAATRRPPGFFLNEHVDDLPPGTSVVKCLGAGENLVMRLPSDVVSDRVLRRGLVYFLAPQAMDFGVLAGDYIIAFKPSESVLAELGKLYLFGLQDRFAVRKCVEVTGGRAVFESPGDADIPLIRSLAPQAHPQDFSEILCVWRMGTSLVLDK